jgi:hypothetical protein
MAAPTLSKDDRHVLDVLVKFKSMPFLELTSVCDMEEKELQRIVDLLEQQDLVKVIDRGNVVDEIVIVREKGFEVGQSSSP